MNLSTSPTLISPFFNHQYPDFPNLWKPERMPSLFIVRAPQYLEQLNEKTYLELIQTRLDRLIQAWTNETSLSKTQELLISSLNQLDSAQSFPLTTTIQDDGWRQEWANLLIHDNWRFQERMGHYGITFPMTLVTPDDSAYLDLREMHDDTTLEEWLMTLIP
jgi:hypothetical protein